MIHGGAGGGEAASIRLLVGFLQAYLICVVSLAHEDEDQQKLHALQS